MPDAVILRSLEVDLATNSLRLVLVESTEGRSIETLYETATIDIGTGGRLVGVELPDGYVDVMPPEPGTEHLIRSSMAEVGVERAGGEAVALVVPRRGAGYEITYPSGNQ
ncbi:MAG TPA: hypothetical protein VD789_02185 [Thermomicrobiales bacterium]|nr:hypothetical protein [Thermomicrobiales bacterium]